VRGSSLKPSVDEVCGRIQQPRVLGHRSREAAEEQVEGGG